MNLFLQYFEGRGVEGQGPWPRAEGVCVPRHKHPVTLSCRRNQRITAAGCFSVIIISPKSSNYFLTNKNSLKQKAIGHQLQSPT